MESPLVPHRTRTALAAVILAGSTACASVAPKYAPSPDNVNRLRDAGVAAVNVGPFTADPTSGDGVNQLSIRGGEYRSPYEGSFVNYLREALRQDLEDARLLSPSASVEVGGVLVKNTLDTGVSTGTAFIEARFTVKRDGKVRFDKVKSAKHEWESSFIGAIAIPRSQQNYPTAVQLLLTQLYSDAEFIAALKR
jgi:hypothetical protein